MSIAHGFYWGVFYPKKRPPHNPGDESTNSGSCFAQAGQPENYKGFLFNTTVLRSDYILYA